jgi:hypothetical protein
MNSFFSFSSSPSPDRPATPTGAAEPAPGPRLTPDPARVFRAPALPVFQPWWQEVPFSAHLGPRIREHV